ncbi:MAG: hypothetical protein JW864_05195 [Spirochaetes bacterium]|nr:hypothetical protein [Spirochaetota bacterium]
MQTLFTIEDVKKKIEQGEKLILAGDEKTLKQLPQGHWIAGTIPYFMTKEGGIHDTDRIYVTQLPSYIKKVTLRTYSEKSISDIYKDIPENGLGIIIIPASSPVHLSFALNGSGYDEFATRPLTGWISGVHVEDIGKINAKVFYGEKNKVIEDEAVAMLLEIPGDKYAEVNIVNIFKQGNGDSITFDSDGFDASEAIVNGEKVNFAEYIKKAGFDTRLPLVANYKGAMINTSFQGIDEERKKVNFYAPVFKGIEYKHAAPVGDYVTEFTGHMPHTNTDNIFFSCNCILNYLYSELEGKSTGGITGPVTFGEIAYQLLNQTMAYVSINDVK